MLLWDEWAGSNFKGRKHSRVQVRVAPREGLFLWRPCPGVGGKIQGQESVGRSAMSGICCLFGSWAWIFRWCFRHGKEKTLVFFALLFQVEIRNIQSEGSAELLLT